MAEEPHRVQPAYFNLLTQFRAASSATSEGSRQTDSRRAVAKAAGPAVAKPSSSGLPARLATSTRTQRPLLCSLRRSCPACHEELVPFKHRTKYATDGVEAVIVAEPEAYTVSHQAKVCMRCCQASGLRTKYWHGYYESTDGGEHATWCKHVDMDFLPESVWMVNKSFGIEESWARKWRIRLYSHRSSFVGEGHILKALQPEGLPDELDNMLLSGWVRWQVWRRAREAGAEVTRVVAAQVLQMEIEELIAANLSFARAYFQCSAAPLKTKTSRRPGF